MSSIRFSLALLLSQPVALSSPFNGTWLMDLDSMKLPPEITTFSLRSGVFSRAEQGPGFVVKADGRIHRIASDNYVDAVAVTVLGARRVREIDRLNGRLAYSVTYNVPVDGRTMTARVVDFGKPDGKPIPTVTTYSRISRPEPGGSPLSGRWRKIGATTTRGHLTENFRLDGSRFSNAGPGGYGYDALIGGPPAPVRGDAPTAQTAVTMPDDRTIVEHKYLNGTLTITKTMTLLPDGRTIKVVGQRQGETASRTWLLHKQ
jgi:hypothetical protein